MTQLLDRLADTSSRHRIAYRRRRIEQLLADSAYFADDDRLVMEQIYRHQIPLREVAVLLKCTPRALQFRVKALLGRTREPLFRFVVDHRELVPSHLEAIARRYVLEGRSLRQTARTTGQSLHGVRMGIQDMKTRARCWFSKY